MFVWVLTQPSICYPDVSLYTPFHELLNKMKLSIELTQTLSVFQNMNGATTTSNYVCREGNHLIGKSQIGQSELVSLTCYGMLGQTLRDFLSLLQTPSTPLRHILNSVVLKMDSLPLIECSSKHQTPLKEKLKIKAGMQKKLTSQGHKNSTPSKTTGNNRNKTTTSMLFTILYTLTITKYFLNLKTYLKVSQLHLFPQEVCKQQQLILTTLPMQPLTGERIF